MPTTDMRPPAADPVSPVAATVVPSPPALPALPDPRSPGWALSALSAAALAACGGGGGSSAGGGGSSSSSSSSASSSTSSSSSSSSSSSASSSSSSASSSSSSASSSSSSSAARPTATEAARFLAQAGLSSTDAEIASVQSLGYAAWIDQQVASARTTTGWDWLMARGYNATAQLNAAAPSDHMAWSQLITATDPLRKRVALALSEILVVSVNGIAISGRALAMAAYWDILVDNAFGNFRTLLEQITLNPAMGVYLNTRGNQKENTATGRQPDENYAREVMQLFTIGLYDLNLDGTVKTNTLGQPIESYTQSSITNLARVFTGWNFDTRGADAANQLQVKNPMTVTASLHSTLAATFLGKTIAANTAGDAALKIALDALFGHANVAPFIGRQLIQRLVTSNPSPAYVARVSQAFNNNGQGVRGDLGAVVRAVLLDAEARAAPATQGPTWGKLREPMLRLVQWARSFKVASASDAWQIGDMSDPATRLSQSPLRSGSVFNFFRPGYVPPNTALANAALLAPEFQITNESTVAAYVNWMQNVIQNGILDCQPNYASEQALVNDPTALVDRLNLMLAAGQLSGATVATIRDAIATISVGTQTGQSNRVRAAILLVMAAPAYIVQK